MNLFALSGLLSGIACTIMAGMVYFTTRRQRVNLFVRHGCSFTQASHTQG